MPDGDLFAHSCPTQQNINILVYWVVKRMDGSRLSVRHPSNPWHTDLAYDVSDKLTVSERKLCRNEEKRVGMITSGIRQLVDNHVLELTRVNGGRDLVLTIGHSAPTKMPKLISSSTSTTNRKKATLRPKGQQTKRRNPVTTGH